MLYNDIGFRNAVIYLTPTDFIWEISNSFQILAIITSIIFKNWI